MSQYQFDYREIAHKASQLLCNKSGVNLHDRCVALIYFCIEAGITDGNQIVSAVHRIDPALKPAFVGIKLKHPAGEGFWHKKPGVGYVLN